MKGWLSWWKGIWANGPGNAGSKKWDLTREVRACFQYDAELSTKGSRSYSVWPTGVWGPHKYGRCLLIYIPGTQHKSWHKTKNSVCIYWVSGESWLLDWKNPKEFHILFERRCPSSLEPRPQANTWTVYAPHFRSWATPGPAIHDSCAPRWGGLWGCQRGLPVRKHQSPPYLLAVGSLLLSGSRVLCHSLQGGRRPHQTGKGPWSSLLPSSGLWGNTPWLARSSPAQPAAGRLRRKGEGRENAMTQRTLNGSLWFVLPAQERFSSVAALCWGLLPWDLSSNNLGF